VRRIRCQAEPRPCSHASIERFNPAFRDEVLTAYVFEPIGEVRALGDVTFAMHDEPVRPVALGRDLTDPLDQMHEVRPLDRRRLIRRDAGVISTNYG
jgi:hypothetical protein